MASKADPFAALTAADLAELDALLSAPLNFREFVDRANPGFIWYKAHEMIADALERVARDELKNLMVFMPPQEGKSELIARLFPAYYLTQHPDRWVGVGSYSFALAKGFSRSARSYYREVTADLSDEAGAVEQWETARKGGLWAVGRGGSATGRPAHLAIIDDPLKDRNEAESEVTRETLLNWFNGVIRMRMQPENAKVIVHTRWHEGDLSGALLELEKTSKSPEHWHVIDLPGIAERPEERPKYPPSVTLAVDWRKPGEALGGRYSMERYVSIRENAGAREFESQIQQRPGAAAGTILLRSWWKRYTHDPYKPLAFERTIISVDATFKDADDSDFVAIHAYGRIGTHVYGRERTHRRMSFTDTVAECKAYQARYPDAILYIEDKANGSAIINTLTSELMGVIPVNPSGGKIARAYATQGDVQHGRVSLPTGSDWDEMVAECASFPNAAHDDDVDAFTQAMAIFRFELVQAMAEKVPDRAREDYASPLVYNRGNPAVPTYEPFRPDRGRRKIQGLPRPHQKRGITVNVEGL